MNNPVRELFVHCQEQKPQVVQAAPGDNLLDVFSRLDVVIDDPGAAFFFVGESDEALRKPEDTDDRDNLQGPVDAKLLIEDLGSGHHHVHCYGCRYVEVDVNFGGQTEHRKFSPATTIGVVTTWACRKLGLDGAAATDCVLRFCESKEQPRPDKYLGEVVQKECGVCFDLVKELTPQG